MTKIGHFVFLFRSPCLFSLQAKVDSGLSGGGGSGSPSKVIHIRHLPSDTTEREVRSLAVLFGRIDKLLMLQSKNQALLEMDDLEDAIKLVDFYSTVPANIRFVHMCVYMCVYMCVVFVCLHACACIHTCMHIVRACVSAYVSTYVCV